MRNSTSNAWLRLIWEIEEFMAGLVYIICMFSEEYSIHFICQQQYMKPDITHDTARVHSKRGDVHHLPNGQKSGSKIVSAM